MTKMNSATEIMDVDLDLPPTPGSCVRSKPVAEWFNSCDHISEETSGTFNVGTSRDSLSVEMADGAHGTVEKIRVHQYAPSRRRSRSSVVLEPSTQDTDNIPKCLDHLPLHDVYDYFNVLNRQFFQGKLNKVDLQINSHMTRSIGRCSFDTGSKKCVIRLSQCFLKNESKETILETMLHEMIHAYLFITDNDDEVNDGHGPNFEEHMDRINQVTGLNISIYYDCDDSEVTKKQYWKCDACHKKRSSADGPPGPQNSWWVEHAKGCGGTYHKVVRVCEDIAVRKGVKNSNLVARNSL